MTIHADKAQRGATFAAEVLRVGIRRSAVGAGQFGHEAERLLAHLTMARGLPVGGGKPISLSIGDAADPWSMSRGFQMVDVFGFGPVSRNPLAVVLSVGLTVD